MTIYNKTTLQNFRKENLVEIVKHQEDEIEKLNQEKEILQCDLDNANSKLKELLENDKKIIEENYKEIERLNNIINSLEETLNKLIKEQLEQYHKREENWEERRNVSNTWLTSRDCYYSILKYLHELKGVDKK